MEKGWRERGNKRLPIQEKKNAENLERDMRNPLKMGIYYKNHHSTVYG